MPVTILQKVKVSDVFSDKISGTYQPNTSAEEDHLEKRIGELILNGEAKRRSMGAYHISVRLALAPDFSRSFLFQCFPYDPNYRFARVEFNPAQDDMVMVRKWLDHILPGGYQDFIDNGLCTRVDATVDLHHIDINKLVISCSGISRTSVHMGGDRMETYYLGSKVSPRMRCVYDKNKQLKSNGFTPHPHPVTRVECRLKNGVEFQSLADLDNPFKALNIASLMHIPTYNDEFFEYFLHSCASDGAQKCLLALKNESTRKKFRARLKLGTPAWWDPDAIWQKWPAAVSSVLDVPSSLGAVSNY